ncbi:MAG: Acetyl xylan esterase [Verrucomicrobiales bacterium]|nr:Acetyl xylan esterase [Verrucomicrobiales bacterium]
MKTHLPKTLMLFAVATLSFRGCPMAIGALAASETCEGVMNWTEPPPQFRNELGTYVSPLQFGDNQTVHTLSDWNHHRKLILEYWNRVMGSWPPLLRIPKIDNLSEEKREGFVQRKVRVQLTETLIDDGYLLVPEGKGPFPAVLVVFYEPESSIGKGKNPLLDFGYQLARRGFVTLSIGSPGGDAWKPERAAPTCQPLSFLAYVAANCHTALAQLPCVDANRIGIVGHSYGGKWAMFASCLYQKFTCAVWSDPGIVFDEARPNVNYWEPWYLGADPRTRRKPGLLTQENSRTGAYKTLIEEHHDLHELHALMAPRPFLVSGGSEDSVSRWAVLNHAISVYKILGYTNRVAMTNRTGHSPTADSNQQIYDFFTCWLGPKNK